MNPIDAARKESREFWETAKKNGRFTIKNPLDGSPMELELPTDFPPHVQGNPSLYELICTDLGYYQITEAENYKGKSDSGIPNFGFCHSKDKFKKFYIHGQLGKMPWDDAVEYAKKKSDTRDGMGVQADAKYLSWLILMDHYIAIQAVAVIKKWTTLKGHTVDTLLDVDGPLHRMGQARTKSRETDVEKKRQAEDDIRQGKKLPYVNLKVCTRQGKEPRVIKAEFFPETGRIIADCDEKENVLLFPVKGLHFTDTVVGIAYFSGINYKIDGTNLNWYQPSMQCDNIACTGHEEKAQSFGGAPIEKRIVPRDTTATQTTEAVQQTKPAPGPPAEPVATQKRVRGDDEFHNDGITDADMEAAAEVEEAERLDAERREKMRRLD